MINRKYVSAISKVCALAVLLAQSVPSSAFEGGRLAKPGEFPTIQLLGTFDSCSGVMIRPDLILTAAHCVSPPDHLPVKSLELRSASNTDLIRVAIKAVFVHPDLVSFISAGGKASESINCAVPDVAIVALQSPIAAFPIANIDTRPILQTGELLYVGGYGAENKDQESGIGSIEVMFMPLRVAKEPLRDFDGNCFLLSDYDSEGNGYSVTAVGDSGGPVYAIYSNGTMGVVGVVTGGGKGGFFSSAKDYYSRLDDGAPTSVPMSTWLASVFNGTAVPIYKN